jgi:ribonuclease R
VSISRRKRNNMNNEEIEGVVSGHRDGHGFVVCDGAQSDIYLPPNEMRAVLHKDRVRVRIARSDRRGRPEGRVTEILERSADPIIGRLLNESGIYLVAPEDKRYGQDVLVSKNAIGSAQVGQVVVVELTEPPALYGQPVGRVKEVLGEIDDPGMEIEIAVRKYSVPHEFSEECLRLAKGLPDKVRATDKKGRVDLTDVPLVTIDGEDARDFDDAVYCEPAKVGRGKGWRLLVAIADVSHYVQPGNAIDVDAFERATSVYFPRRVIPMLPEKLSNGLCSLNPEVERLCMVCDMLITAAGDVHAYQFYPAVMFSHARFTYNEVATILQNTRSHEALQRGELVPHLLNLHDVYRGLLQARQKRGAVDFETVETQIIADDTGRIERIVPRTRNDAHKVIEEAMLAANVCAAEFIAQSKHAGIFRVHEGPPANKLEILRNYLKAMGVTQTLGDNPKPGDYQAIAQATKDRPEAKQIHTMLLRSMQQAIYTPINSGHFGLAFEAYTHFTSPIRRYPDLMVHRVIKAVLTEKKYQLPDSLLSMKVPPQRKKPAGAAPEQPKKVLTGQSLAWEMVGLHCSANERRADEASRDVEAWLKCKYMREHLGEEFTGQVTAVTSFGLFVTLDAMYVEGLVHITELGGDFFKFDDMRQELRGERTGIRYALGTVINIQVSRVDLDGRRIDFRLVKPEGEAARVERGERGDRPERQDRFARNDSFDKTKAGSGARNSRSAGAHVNQATQAKGGKPAKAVKGKRAAAGTKPMASKAPSKKSRRG